MILDPEPKAGADQPARSLPAVVGLAALALYLSLPSLRHNFDGVACAIAVELGDLRHLVHGNHLAYGLVGLAFHRLLAGAGLAVPAIWALQLMDSLLGALGAGLFARLLLRRGRPAAAAAAAALGLAVSQAWWLRSIDAQVYLLAAPFLVCAFEEALDDRPGGLRLALLHAAAMLAHVSHLCFAPVALYSLRRAYGDGEEGRRETGRYLAFCAVAVPAAYCAALTLCVAPASSADVRLWLLGSAALGPGRSFNWLSAGTPWSALGHWCHTALRAASVRPLLAAPLWAAAAWAWALPAGRRERPLCLLWLASYAPLLLSYEPWNMDYRIMDLVPLWFSASAALTARPLALYAAALGAANAAWAVLPVSRLETNAPLQKTLWLDEALPEDAWVAALSIEEVYIPYFTHRRTLNLRWYEGRPAALQARVSELLAAGEPVYATSDVLAAGWDAALSAFPRTETGRRGEVVLYRLSATARG